MSTLRIGIVAGEASGDILGSSLMQAIKSKHPDVTFEGVGGPLMIAEGFESHFPMDRLSVMGFVEPLKRLPELLRIRRSLKAHFIASPPDLFIGIDSPDFTLNIELALRQEGILTAHYVSPSVWAWRQGRVKNIAKAVDRMLTLLPFEAEFYHQHNVPVTFVGHPLADKFSIELDQLARQKQAARGTLSLANDDTIVALLPGSRGGEVNMLGQSFIETARWCLHQRADLKFVIPAANEARRAQLEALLEEYGKGLPISLVDGQSQTVMAAADVVLMASGTTTLEALLLKKPMVVAYRLAALTYFIASRLVKSPYFSLPNLLAGEEMVPEVLQHDVRPEMLGPLVLERLHKDAQAQIVERFTEIHKTLKLNASERAADVLLTMIENNQS
ncbi:lipid-A-disaccharide synthase [Oceanicoccus sagamiensis]|uniref:Lipid-A-disaccharide synthase n=1 Tax=Oceanicoccus sagamiensis TaxID=716816 RepID=A0A1X9NHL0_9GAMM|nr:lipid-A-disaccharide synthase [Oceanicoccus sagamiensis]ARN74999.1 lipid-A-disaccharide synthase [Oceanicoccus sagamiensis]